MNRFTEIKRTWETGRIDPAPAVIEPCYQELNWLGGGRPFLLPSRMFIIWGKKRIERKQGMVADFCPICREVRAFTLIRVGLAGHIYYVSFGQGKLAGFIICCDTCGVVLRAEPTRFATAEKDPRIELETLIRQTFPRLRETYADRLALEQRIKRTRSALTAEQYKEFLMEPFALLNPVVEQRFAKSTQMASNRGSVAWARYWLGAGSSLAQWHFTERHRIEY